MSAYLFIAIVVVVIFAVICSLPLVAAESVELARDDYDGPATS